MWAKPGMKIGLFSDKTLPAACWHTLHRDAPTGRGVEAGSAELTLAAIRERMSPSEY